MKKIQLLPFFVMAMYQSYPQNVNNNLPSEFKEVALRAMEKVSPGTKQWFTNIARQHPEGSFDTSWAKQKLREKFAAGDVNNTEALFMVMIAYQRMVNKETFEDRRLTTTDRQRDFAGKENKLKTNNAQIDQQRREAAEKQDNQMTAAQVNLWTGIVSGSSGAGFQSGVSDSVSKSSGKNNQIKHPVQLYPNTNPPINSSNLKVKNDHLTLQSNAEWEKAGSEEAKKGNGNDQKAKKDAIKKLYDQLEEMKKI